MYRLTAKHVALALNAVRDRDVMKHSEYRELFRAGAKRVLQLAASTRSSASAASSPLPGLIATDERLFTFFFEYFLRSAFTDDLSAPPATKLPFSLLSSTRRFRDRP